MTLLTPDQQRELDERGFVVFPGLLAPGRVAQVLDRLEELWAAEGDQASRENYIEPGVRRLANLANKGDIFRSIFGHPLVLAAVTRVMGSQARLSMLNAREVPPRYGGQRQEFHTDTDRGGRPDPSFFSCTAVWMLDPFTADNGATRIIPGSHKTGQLPRDVMADVHAPHLDEVPLTGMAGDVAVFNGHCWHAGGVNVTDQPRRAILAHYLRADIPRPADRRQHLSAEVRAHMTERELELLGVGEKQVAVRVKLAAENLLRSIKTKVNLS